MSNAAGPEGRRSLRFETIDDMLTDVRACAAGCELERLGTWSLGQALHHLAAWIDYSYVGYPPELVFTDAVKAQARAAKERIMHQPMKPGERIPGPVAGTYATEDVPLEVGLAELESAAGRLRSDAPVHPDPAFGLLTRQELTAMTLRHAELHLSFFARQ
jgi:hypothetical protein